MSKGKAYETYAEELLIPIAEENHVEIYDVEYVKEGSEWYLRAYIDKPEGVTIDDCEAVSRAMSAKLDETDTIQDAYILEVSSPGLGRTLTKEKHFLKSIGKEVELKSFSPVQNKKQFKGILQSYEEGILVLETADQGKLSFKKTEIASVKLAIDF